MMRLKSVLLDLLILLTVDSDITFFGLVFWKIIFDDLDYCDTSTSLYNYGSALWGHGILLTKLRHIVYYHGLIQG